MKYVHRAIDFLQALFPPNRIAVLLGGLLTAVSGSIAAWLAANFPGLNLGAPEVAGVMAAALLITVRLLDRWIDQWQRGEQIDAAADLEMALDDLAADPAVQHALSELAQSLGLNEEIGEKIALLRTRVEGGDVPPPEVAAELGNLADAIASFLHDHPVPAELVLAEPEPAR